MKIRIGLDNKNLWREWDETIPRSVRVLEEVSATLIFSPVWTKAKAGRPFAKKKVQRKRSER